MTLKSLIFCVLAACFAVLGAKADIAGVRIVGDGAPTRVTIWSDVEYSAEAYLTEAEGRPQILVTLDGASSAMQTPRGAGTGGVGTWTMTPGRLTLKLDRPMMVARQLSLPPVGDETRHRLILDLQTVAPVRFSRAAQQDTRRLAMHTRTAPPPRQAAPPVQTATAEQPSKPLFSWPTREPKAAPNGKYVIVIDPGHGGKDPGASHHGAVEKDVVLKAATYLKSILDADKRYIVHLTRSDDTFIELEDRVTKAREWDADLFISVHADAAGKPSVKGASIYTISKRGENRIDREASKNDWKMPIEDGSTEEVTGILTSLIKRETKTRSAEFAELLLPELAKAGPTVRNTHRNAGFYVLLAPDVPAVLVEMGFLTNREDARRLKSASGRKKSMKAVKRGIDTYFDRQDVIMADLG